MIKQQRFTISLFVTHINILKLAGIKPPGFCFWVKLVYAAIFSKKLLLSVGKMDKAEKPCSTW